MDVARRVFVGLGLAGAAVWIAELRIHGSDDIQRMPATVRIVEFDAAGRAVQTAEVPTIRRSDAEWKKVLAVDEYTVTRRNDTEMAFAGEFWNFHGDGLYRCVCCGTALFDSVTKFASGTGWPSFTQPIAKENVSESADRSWGMARTAVSCRRCAGHLGHVFDDGPPPTGLRYCINSVALRFLPRANT